MYFWVKDEKYWLFLFILAFFLSLDKKSWQLIFSFAHILLNNMELDILEHIYILFISDLQLQILLVLLVVEPSHCARSSDLNASAVEELFVRQLFKKYGNESAISFEALEHLFQNLELGSMQITHRLNDHRDKTGFEPEHSDHQHKPVDNRIIKTHKRNHIHRRNLDVLTKVTVVIKYIF